MKIQINKIDNHNFCEVSGPYKIRTYILKIDSLEINIGKIYIGPNMDEDQKEFMERIETVIDKIKES